LPPQQSWGVSLFTRLRKPLCLIFRISLFTSFLVVVPAPPIRGMGPMVIFGSTLLAILGLSGLVGGVFEVPIAGAFFNTFFLATADARPLLHYRSCPLSSFFPG